MFGVIALLMSAGSMMVATPTLARHDDDRDNNRYERDRNNQDDQDQSCDRECCERHYPQDQDRETREEREQREQQEQDQNNQQDKDNRRVR